MNLYDYNSPLHEFAPGLSPGLIEYHRKCLNLDRIELIGSHHQALIYVGSSQEIPRAYYLENPGQNEFFGFHEWENLCKFVAVGYV